MTLSVIIPTLNEEKYIAGILKDLHAQTQPPLEVIVVDGKSSDATSRIASDFALVNVHTRDPHVGAQRHAGGEKARGDLLLFLDADTRIETDMLRESIDQILSRKLGVACPRYIPITESTKVRWFYHFFNAVFRLTQGITPSGAGGAIFVSKQVFQNSGGISDKHTFDDIEFIRRAAKHGKFGIISTEVKVSDRRFKKYGFWNVVRQYVKLSVLFSIGRFGAANKINYEFAKYDE